jgi:hypothetical protein
MFQPLGAASSSIFTKFISLIRRKPKQKMKVIAWAKFPHASATGEFPLLVVTNVNKLLFIRERSHLERSAGDGRSDHG